MAPGPARPGPARPARPRSPGTRAGAACARTSHRTSQVSRIRSSAGAAWQSGTAPLTAFDAPSSPRRTDPSSPHASRPFVHPLPHKMSNMNAGMAFSQFQSVQGPADSRLRHTELEGYQPVSRIGEIVINSFGATTHPHPHPHPPTRARTPTHARARARPFFGAHPTHGGSRVRVGAQSMPLSLRNYLMRSGPSHWTKRMAQIRARRSSSSRTSTSGPPCCPA